MKLLVTGGAGFIGSRIATQLIEANHHVTIYDNLTTGLKTAIPDGAHLIVGDIRDPDTLRTAVEGQDAVIHLAAQALVPESVADPQKAFDINLGGGQNLLEAMRAAGVSKLVHSSTAAVYGIPRHIPVHEDDPKLPINPYGATKYAFEQLLHAYHVSFGLSVVMFRYFNPYGPTEAHDPETHAIPNFINAAISGKPVPLDWDGQQTRDFFYVDDIARAHVMGLARNGFETYNLGSGTGEKVRDVVEKIFELTGSRSSINDLGERAGDPPELLADTSKARDELGWAPQISLEEGLKRTIAAFRQRHSQS
jgi:UDP-glucose 4-epimerase